MWHRIYATSGDPLVDFLVNNASVVGVLALVLVLLIRGKLVTGRELEAKQKECDRITTERDRALELVYGLATATSRAVDVAEKVTK